MLTRLALYTALGLVLATQDWTVSTWQFWSVVALFWASEYLARLETRDQLVAELARLQKQFEEQEKADNREQ